MTEKGHRQVIKKLLPCCAAVVLTVTSCTYDPNYSPFGASASYGYGYGGSDFSTSLFVSTGDARWGYDPHTYCYYDYRSRRYYDPYLYGFYPVGYRPRTVYGVPHPHGWRPGREYCPPPRTVRNVTVVNYHNRESAYRNSGHSWANEVRQAPIQANYREGREQRQHHDRRSTPIGQSASFFRPDQGWFDTSQRERPVRRSQAEFPGMTQAPAPPARPDFGSASPHPSDNLERLRMNENTVPGFERPSRELERAPGSDRPDRSPSGDFPENRGQAPEPRVEPAPAQSDDPARLRGLGEG